MKPCQPALPGGRIEAAVVTVQDMTPIEEMERQRGEFLSMVSHELRTPLTAIKGSAARVAITWARSRR